MSAALASALVRGEACARQGKTGCLCAYCRGGASRKDLSTILTTATVPGKMAGFGGEINSNARGRGIACVAIQSSREQRLGGSRFQTAMRASQKEPTMKTLVK